ncbi:MAG: HD domain-containing protein [Candidatus Aenigmatarchaeota archaeon]
MVNEVSKEDLIELTEEIEDKELRSKTSDLLDNLELSNENFDYEKSDLEKIPCWIGGHHYYEGGLIEHIYSVVKLCIDLADNFKEFYGRELDRDSLISAALLHDLAKQFIIEGMEGFGDYKLDHEVWISCELYSRGFPEKVIEIIMGHGGETHEPMPKSEEAKILHHADSLDAEMNEDEVFGGGAVLEL